MAASRWIIEIPDHFKTQEMFNEAMRKNAHHSYCPMSLIIFRRKKYVVLQ